MGYAPFLRLRGHRMSKDTAEKKSTLVERIGERFGVDGVKVFETLKSTAFKQRNGSAPTNEQMLALLTVAEQYGLNPFTKELFAFPDGAGGIIPLVSVDGWARIINSHSAMDGIEFVSSEKMVRMDGAKVDCPEWIECIIYRSDRKHPIKIREYLDEVYRAPFVPKGKTYAIEGPWQSHPKRFLRHKTLIQASRIAFGFSGIYDRDEAERIAESKSSGFGSGNHIKDMGDVVIANNQSPKKPTMIPAKPFGDKMLNALIERAKQDATWDISAKYVSERLSGENLQDALERLELARMEHHLVTEEPKANEATHQEPEPFAEHEYEAHHFNNVNDAFV